MSKQIQAVKLAVEALKRERRLYATQEAMFKHGFENTENGHKHYVQHTEAIQELEALIEILTDNKGKKTC